jgi:methionyl-tRNA formyltransferase
MAAAEKNSRVIFFGSPEFALPSLKILAGSEYRPVLVVTQPDRPAGRGKKLVPTPVRQWAEGEGLEVAVVGGFEQRDSLDRLSSLEPDFFVVVAFGLIFPKEMLRIASRANINLHASMLPAYRGASPVNMAIVRGEKSTGVTTMEMRKELDAGPIYLQKRVEIDPMENAGELSGRLSVEGASVLLETLRGIDRGQLSAREQPERGVSMAPRLKKNDGLIPWELDAPRVHDHIRGMNPWPGSHTYHMGEYLKVHRAEPFEGARDPGRHGVVIETGREGIVVSCGCGAVRVTRLQAPGRKAHDAQDFLRGYELRPGAVFESKIDG